MSWQQRHGLGLPLVNVPGHRQQVVYGFQLRQPSFRQQRPSGLVLAHPFLLCPVHYNGTKNGTGARHGATRQVDRSPRCHAPGVKFSMVICP